MHATLFIYMNVWSVRVVYNFVFFIKKNISNNLVGNEGTQTLSSSLQQLTSLKSLTLNLE